jgi:hypothetical protein
MQGEVRVVREEPMNADNGFVVDLGDVTTLGDAPTPLGGAAPFEYRPFSGPSRPSGRINRGDEIEAPPHYQHRRRLLHGI